MKPNRTEFIGINLYYSQDFVDDMRKELERQRKIIRKLDIKNLRLTTTLKEIKIYIDSITWNTSVSNIQDNIWYLLDKEKK